MAGDKEHAGNRNYFGPERIARAQASPIHAALARIATIRARNRRHCSAACRSTSSSRATARRSFASTSTARRAQIALVLLNKGDAPATFSVDRYLDAGAWRDATGGKVVKVRNGKPLVRKCPRTACACCCATEERRTLRLWPSSTARRRARRLLTS